MIEEKEVLAQEQESSAEILKRLTRENALPDLEPYKEVWVREMGDLGVFFCRKNSVWWILECVYSQEGKIIETTDARMGKVAPWDQLRAVHGVSKDQFKTAFKRIK